MGEEAKRGIPLKGGVHGSAPATQECRGCGRAARGVHGITQCRVSTPVFTTSPSALLLYISVNLHSHKDKHLHVESVQILVYLFP